MSRARAVTAAVLATAAGLATAAALATVVLLATPPAARAQEPPPLPLTLADALERALATHPATAAAREMVSGADARVAEARGARLPELGFHGGTTRFELPMVVAPLHALDPTGDPPAFDRTLVQSRAVASWTVFDGGARTAAIREREAAREGASAGLDDAVADLLERTVAAYADVLARHAFVQAAQDRLAALEAERDRAARLHEEGREARVAILRADAAMSEARAASVSARAQLDRAQRTLARLTGLPADRASAELLEPIRLRPEPPPDPAPPGAAPPDPPPPDAAAPGAAPPDPALPAPLVAARHRVEAAEASLRLARTARFPRIEALARLNQFGGADTRATTEWDAGVQLSWAVFTGGRRTASIELAEAELRRTREELRAAELRIDEAVDLARVALDEAHARADALSAAVSQLEEVARIEALALEVGSGVQSDFLAAHAALAESRAGLAGAERAKITARTALARAQGALSLPWILDTMEVAR